MRASRNMPLPDRIRAKVTMTATGCWEWGGHVCKDGYGHLATGGRMRLVHRVSYETFKAAIPVGTELDHLCRNRKCCNPEHLEPVSHAENVRRGSEATKATCRNGHPLSGAAANVRTDEQGRRVCRACNSAAVKRYKLRKYRS